MTPPIDPGLEISHLSISYRLFRASLLDVFGISLFRITKSFSKNFWEIIFLINSLYVPNDLKLILYLKVHFYVIIYKSHILKKKRKMEFSNKFSSKVWQRIFHMENGEE